jgi:4-amino-4-deoxy-L-arabinose transferase-like glycosyltransferase
VYGYATALVAAGIFSMLPVVLAHSALATTDIALAACYIVAVYAFTLWLEVPNWRTATRFGIAAGLAIATKLSTLAFLPTTMLGILLPYLAARRRTSTEADGKGWGLGNMRNLMVSIVVAIICAFVTLWASYRFSHAPINEISPAPAKMAARVFGPSSSAARGIRFLTAKVQLPAPELFEGVRQLRDINSVHPPSYLFGQVKRGGWWYFYPVAIAVKTPLAVLLFALIGAVWLGLSWFRKRTNWQAAVPIAAFLAPIVIAAPTSLDIGVRHVMPVFAFLSMLAAVGAVRVWNYRPVGSDSRGGWNIASWTGRAAVAILFAWFIASSARAHPDYLAYFNELGGRHPENILVISDFDWGQDLNRLASYLREHEVRQVSIAYENYFDPDALGFPDVQYVECGETPSGWVAVEVRRARLYRECYPWLSQQRLVTTVGKTMLIYYVPKSGNPGMAPAMP